MSTGISVCTSSGTRRVIVVTFPGVGEDVRVTRDRHQARVVEAQERLIASGPFEPKVNYEN